MVQYPRHAVVEFHPDWAIKSWHCVLCGSQCDSQEQLKSHLQFHEIKDVIATVITTGNLQNGAAINFKHSFITDSTADVSISTGDVAAHVKKEINDSDDYMPLEEVESDNESFGAKLEPNDDDSEIPEFKIEAVHSDDNEMETSFTYDENANSPEEAIKFNCNYCDKSFDTKPKLERHQKLNHEVLVCPVRNCTQKLVDVNHIMKHSTISPRFKSQHVAQTATKTSLSAGQSSQDEKSSVPVLPPVLRNYGVGEWPNEGTTKTTTVKQGYICEFCGKKYKSNTGRKDHQAKVHMKQTRHKCAICERGFQSQTQMTSHVFLVHMKVKRFTCESCGAGYTHNKDLRKHTCKATSEKEFQCDQCARAYFSERDLARHVASAHIGEVFRCTQCTKQFKYRSCLNRHMKKMHVLLEQEDSS